MTLFDILNTTFQNRDKNFVQRILQPEKYPFLNNGRFQDPSTHSMAWGTNGQGEHFVYPTVIQAQPGGWLQRLNQEEAWKHASRTGEWIPFGKDAARADQYSKDYKLLWNKQQR